MPRQTILPKFKFGFCPSKRIDILGVLRDDGRYFYYYLNEKTLKLKPLQCLECQPLVEESNLRPYYSVFVESLWKHVIFVFNNVTDSIEQYTFNKSTGGFEQVEHPALQYKKDRPQSDVICTIQGDEKHDMTLIQKDDAGNFKKLRFIDNVRNYVSIPPVYVKTLVMKKLESRINIQEDNEDGDVPCELPPQSFNSFADMDRPFVIQFCKKLNDTIVAVRLSNGEYMRFYYNHTIGQLVQIDCDECHKDPCEQDLHPVYAVFHHGIGSHVVFMKNYKNFKIEQYIYRPGGGFEQVQILGLVFDPNFVPISNRLFVSEHPSDRTPIVIQRGQNGSVEKVNIIGKGRTIYLASDLVITFEVKQKLLEQEMKKQEERNFMRNFPYSDDQDEWSAKSFSKFMSSSSFKDSGSLSLLHQKYQELVTEIEVRIDRCARFETYNTLRYNMIIKQKAEEMEEIKAVLKKNMPGFVSGWEDSELSSSSAASTSSECSFEMVKKPESESDSDISAEFAKININEVQSTSSP